MGGLAVGFVLARSLGAKALASAKDEAKAVLTRAEGEARAAADKLRVEAEKAALEDVVAVGVLAVDPPGEIDKQFLKYFF